MMKTFCLASVFGVLGSGMKLPVSTGKAAISPIPLPATGSCTAGWEYNIRNLTDVYRYVDELECLFAAGISPSAVPLGFSYGSLLTAANTAFWDAIANPVYQGDFSIKTQCDGTDYTFGWMSIGGFKGATAKWDIGNAIEALPVDLAEGEYPLQDRDVLVMDFQYDFQSLCPVDGAEDAKPLINFLPFQNTLWPMKQFVDVAVVIGRDTEDNGIITLNKAYLVPKEADQGAITVLFYATKNFDPALDGDISVGQSIVVPLGPNGETEISYTRQAVGGIVKRLDGAEMLTAIPDFFKSFITIPTVASSTSVLPVEDETVEEEPMIEEVQYVFQEPIDENIIDADMVEAVVADAEDLQNNTDFQSFITELKKQAAAQEPIMTQNIQAATQNSFTEAGFFRNIPLPTSGLASNLLERRNIMQDVVPRVMGNFF